MGWDSPVLRLCYLSLWLSLFELKTQLESKTLVIELCESQLWDLTCIYFFNLDLPYPHWGVIFWSPSKICIFLHCLHSFLDMIPSISLTPITLGHIRVHDNHTYFQNMASRIWSTSSRRQLCLNIIFTLPPKPPRLDILPVNFVSRLSEVVTLQIVRLRIFFDLVRFDIFVFGVNDVIDDVINFRRCFFRRLDGGWITVD